MSKSRLTFILFLLLGIGLLFPSVFLTFRSIKIISSYETTEGMLVDFKEKWKENKETGEEYPLYAPVFKYFDTSGKTHTIISGEYSSSKSLSSVRQKIYYEKNYPDIAVTGIFQLYFVPLISVFFCLICLITAYIIRKPAII